MGTRLLQVLTFANVGAGATVNLAHNININGTQQIPDFIAADAGGFTITADAVQVSVTNDGDAPATVNVWLELKHSMPRELGRSPTGLTQPSLVPRPFIVAGGAGGGGGGTLLPVVDQNQLAFNLTPSMTNYFTVAGDTGTGTFPAANSVPNGTLLAIRMLGGGDSLLNVVATGGDTIDGPTQFDGVQMGAVFVSDGGTNWICISNFHN